MKTTAIILAAGSGKRMQAKVNKPYLLLLGKPILMHTLAAFEHCDAIDEVVIVAKHEECAYCHEEIVIKGGFHKVIAIVAGGAERQDSVYQGLSVLKDDCELVVVHDGARPLVTPEQISNTIAAVGDCGAILGVPVKDTIKAVDENQHILFTPPREKLWQVQTPQVFLKEQLILAYKKAQADHYNGTDDASLVEYNDGCVKMVLGSYDNLKITTPEDIIMAEAFLTIRQKEGKALCSE